MDVSECWTRLIICIMRKKWTKWTPITPYPQLLAELLARCTEECFHFFSLCFLFSSSLFIFQLIVLCLMLLVLCVTSSLMVLSHFLPISSSLFCSCSNIAAKLLASKCCCSIICIELCKLCCVVFCGPYFDSVSILFCIRELTPHALYYVVTCTRTMWRYPEIYWYIKFNNWNHVFIVAYNRRRIRRIHNALDWMV